MDQIPLELVDPRPDGSSDEPHAKSSDRTDEAAIRRAVRRERADRRWHARLGIAPPEIKPLPRIRRIEPLPGQMNLFD